MVGLPEIQGGNSAQESNGIEFKTYFLQENCHFNKTKQSPCFAAFEGEKVLKYLMARAHLSVSIIPVLTEPLCP